MLVKSSTNSYNGIILIDKAEGSTSFHIDGAVKRILSTKKVGHLGTLDPFATGLLPICVGDSLRIIRYTDNYDKSYRCVARFGFGTDTMDTEGTANFGHIPTKDELLKLVDSDFAPIRESFERISKITEQMPPAYSAKKINGRKAYELAREGKTIELKPCKVKINSLIINSISVTESMIDVDFTVACSKGTYIRTICDDVGRDTGFGAHATSLRRLSSGPFDIKQAITLEALSSMVEQGDYSFFIDDEIALQHLPVIELNAKENADVRLGKKIFADRFEEELRLHSEGQRYRARFEDSLTAIMYESHEELGHVMRIERMLAKND